MEEKKERVVSHRLLQSRVEWHRVTLSEGACLLLGIPWQNQGNRWMHACNGGARTDGDQTGSAHWTPRSVHGRVTASLETGRRSWFLLDSRMGPFLCQPAPGAQKTGTFVQDVHNYLKLMFLESLCTFCTNVPVFLRKSNVLSLSFIFNQVRLQFAEAPHQDEKELPGMPPCLPVSLVQQRIFRFPGLRFFQLPRWR